MQMRLQKRLSEDSAATQARILRQKMQIAIISAAAPDRDVSALRATAYETLAGFFSAGVAEVEVALRRTTAAELVGATDFACWCLFETDASQIFVALDALTTSVASNAALAKPICEADAETITGVDRFLAATLARRLALSILEPDCEKRPARQCNRSAIGTSFADLRAKEFAIGLEAIEISAKIGAAAMQLRFLVGLGSSDASTEGASASVGEVDAEKERVRLRNRILRCALSMKFKVIARKYVTALPFSTAAALKVGDLIHSAISGDEAEIVSISGGAVSRLAVATIGRIAETRAVQVQRLHDASHANVSSAAA